jgi:GTP cyclohydrolase II
MIYSSTILHTQHGDFKINYHESSDGDCVSLVQGHVDPLTPVFVRIHSSCLFSESFHTTDCDCALQLDAAMKKVSEIGKGIIVYLYQEGRGIGLKDKIRAVEYERVHKVDTAGAFLNLQYEALDYRDYTPVANALRELNCATIRIATNNPRKIQFLKEAGFDVVSVERLEYQKTERVEEYLMVKKKKLGHLL